MTVSSGEQERAGRADTLWSLEVVNRLNRWQACDFVHSFTCPGDKACPKRNLTATVDGWICACGTYRQTWAHASMMEREPPMFRDVFKAAAP